MAYSHDDHSTYRMSVPPESVLEFVETHDYIEDSTGVGRIETERIDPGPPYTIDVRELTEVDLYGEPVADGGSLPADRREFLESIVTSDRLTHLLPPGRHQYRSDDPPPTNLREFSTGGDRPTPYVRLEGDVYQFFHHEFRPERVPVNLATEPATPGDGPPRFTLTATVDDVGVDEKLKISARGDLPAVLGATTESGHVVVRGLEHDAYHWSEREVPPTGRYITNEERARVSPGGSVSATCELPASLSTGTHALWASSRRLHEVRNATGPPSSGPIPSRSSLRSGMSERAVMHWTGSCPEMVHSGCIPATPSTTVGNVAG